MWGNGVIITSLPKENNLVVGIDITASTLKKFKNKGYMCLGDVHHLPFKNESFSSVLMGEVLEHLKYPFLALKEVHRTLDKDGCLVISLPNKYGVWSLYVDTLITALKGWNPEGHVNKFSLKDVRKILHDAGFKDYKVINTAIVGSFLRLQALMKLDVYLSKLFPKYFASGWVIKAVKRETS